MSIFEKKFGKSPTSFHTVSEVDDYVQAETGRNLRPVRLADQNFVRPQGCVFPMNDYDIDSMVDSSLKADKCQKSQRFK